MRDVLLSVIIAVLLLKSLGKPLIGAYLWTWLSLMNPHKLTFGFAYSLPWAHAAALTTLVSTLFSKDRKPLPMNTGVVLLLVLWAWMVVTSITSINPPEWVWERLLFVSKINLMLIVTLMLVRGREQINTMVWIVVGSIGFFSFKGGIYTILTAGTGRVWGPPGMLMDNNALAVATVMMLPLMYYLRHVTTNRHVKLGMLVLMVLSGASILGSQSRGALLALLAMSIMLGVKSKYPIRFSIALVMLIALGVAFMPESWTSRMDTIQAYDEDSSAMSRIYTWRTLLNVALDRPLVGAGFRADNLELFARYAPTDGKYDIFLGKVWVAHSIYLQALGEHGFVGLVLYVGIWVWVWFAAARLARQAKQFADLKDWVPLLMGMCQVSVIGFCVGGAFLSLMNLDLPLYILAFVTWARCAVQDEQMGVRSKAGAAGWKAPAQLPANNMGAGFRAPPPTNRPPSVAP